MMPFRKCIHSKANETYNDLLHLSFPHIWYFDRLLWLPGGLCIDGHVLNELTDHVHDRTGIVQWLEEQLQYMKT